jgi:hypothetical protein
MLHEKQTSNGGEISNKYRMARRANGLDLSEAIIIVDIFTIKNTRAMRKFYLAHVFYRADRNQGRALAC